MKKIIITNASDSLGINLANYLLQDEYVHIYAYDKQLTNNIPSMYSLLRNDRYTFIEQDLISEIEVRADEIYHISPCLRKYEFLRDKYEYMLHEGEILRNILSYASVTGAKLLYVNYFSDYKATNTEYYSYFSYIDTSHYLVNEFSNKYKIDFKIAQISDYYGINSNQSVNNFVGEYIVKSFNNEEINLGQNEVLYLTNVIDIVRGLVKIMENYTDEAIFDISNPNPCLKSDILKLIINFTKSHSNVISDGKLPIQPEYVPNVSKLNNLLDFRCTTTILDGVSSTIDFYKLMYFS